jgi:hypothetical protein
MHARNAAIALGAAVLLVPLSAAVSTSANARASAGLSASGAAAPRPRIAPGATRMNSARSALASLELSGPVTLTYSATTSDNDSCTGECTEWGYGSAVDFASYSESASATVTSTITLNGSNGDLSGSAPLDETADFNSTGTVDDPDCPVTDTVTSTGTTPGSLAASLSVTTNSSGTPVLDLSQGNSNGPVENVTETSSDCNGTSTGTTTIEDAMGDIYYVDMALGLTSITGWTVNPNWTASAGGTLATKTITGSTPWPNLGQADVGSMSATQTWKVVTKAGLEITSPPDNSTVALTDDTFFTPQPGPNDRAPAKRSMIVKGTTACPKVTVNGVPAEVTGDNWKAQIAVTDLGAQTLTAKAKGCQQATSTVTIINLVITSPAENTSQSITAQPAMPELNATVSISGYAGDMSDVSFDWTLEARGETVTKNGKEGDWDDYSVTVATGSTTGAEAWQPDYTNIVGGVGRLTVSASVPGVTGKNPVTSDPRWFFIPGSKVPPATAKAFVDSSDPQWASTIRHIICIESNWEQFNSAVEQRQPKIDNVPSDWKPNPGPWQPLFGEPADIGMAQLDPAILASPDQYWNWQASLLGGIRVFHEKLQQAAAWAGREQQRLAERLTRVLDAANRERRHKKLGEIHKNVITVPQLDDDQIRLQAIRLYNGGNEFHFDADYVLSSNGIDVVLLGTGKWVEGKAGNWGRAPKDLHDPVPWVPLADRFQDYVKKVLACKNS